MLFLLEPEVAGGFGDNTIIENFNNVRAKGERPKVAHLHYEFMGWPDDEILERTPCFIVTESLAKDIQKSSLNGYTFENVEISKGDEFEELYPNRDLPKFIRLIPNGLVEVIDDSYKEWSGDDFCMSQKSCLVVSERAFKMLKSHKLNYCEIVKLNRII